MDIKLLLTVFVTVFLAEIGDKTQLATLLYASDSEHSKFTVFVGASLALVLSAAIGVIGGSLLSSYLNPRYLRLIAGIGFLLIGVWTLAKGS